ncbi:bifunctional glutamate N-acetyltransferase/amino-acid acetyltransferase ArgJ [Psychrobacter sanguinis]|uniref:bifunctional glutamate N-acetyltransferase/amino-acid acetyltransferase ArgJ n=1 Tax=Psychrobacter sanguinis TaxID=861445 RepID=UPI00020C9768|nr:bifunctional glutamate N-acetyltransferase/amino-acid acetyltransferase ArgJ [Psychrobacter sanguinis]EGK15472.1 glutamate N-acetyltransferase/amino-acid acetyltransferase [Psychrobacter sp. 1501(2011)]MCD9151553.1 bifunctional glutamate N-acetyltransferase/amino-acid acetyltransferase ArgJ [Psychrobacter sanguinis]
MPVGNIAPPDVIHAINGVEIGITAAGVRYKDRDDLVVFRLADSATVACVTTSNKCCAAPVLLVREHLKQLADSDKSARYLLINTGNANAATGDEGYRRALQTCEALADKTGVAVNQVMPFSTGVIGEVINSEAIIKGLDACLANLSKDNWLAAANAIRTTDTIPKVASTRVAVGDNIEYSVTGISKGAGMIRPNMATMLGYVATDAPIAQPLLQQMLVELTNQSFNRITIDGDTSTNDCCVLIATGDNESNLIDSKQHPHYAPLFEALKQVFIRLATLIVRDGEGATKFITVKVTGGKTVEDCCDVAYAVAHSPLVKTAFFASDPNWGRIVAAVGYSGAENLDANQVSVTLDDVAICTRGQLDPSYTEEQGQEVMSRPEITINIDLGMGDAADTVYTCDLSYEYVSINADYRS